MLFIPKHVETCFLAGSVSSRGHGQACTINQEKLPGGYCAYHTMAANRMVYANLSYPIYHSPLQTALFTCGSYAGIAFGRGHIQSPNHNPDADVEISPTSHEIMEAITDPDLINGHEYMTQTEFSNKDFANTGLGCLESEPTFP